MGQYPGSRRSTEVIRNAQKNGPARILFPLLALALAAVLVWPFAGPGVPGALAGRLTDSSQGNTRGGPSVPNANMTVNGDFETGSTVPFTTTIGSGAGAINSNASFVHAGSFSARITTSATAGSSSGVGGGGTCSSGVRIPVSANTSYTWSGFILVPTGTNIGSARIRV